MACAAMWKLRLPSSVTVLSTASSPRGEDHRPTWPEWQKATRGTCDSYGHRLKYSI